MTAKIKAGLRRISELVSSENREALMLLLRELLYILRHGRFRSIKGNIELGSESPHIMGQLLSILSLAYPLYGSDELKVTPYFDRDRLLGELHIKGHLRLFHVLMSLIRILKNKKLRSILLERD